jgi:hypothetical protein
VVRACLQEMELKMGERGVSESLCNLIFSGTSLFPGA